MKGTEISVELYEKVSSHIGRKTFIREQIESAVDNNSKVKLYYDEKFYQWAFFGDTKYFVNKVEVIPTEK